MGKDADIEATPERIRSFDVGDEKIVASEDVDEALKFLRENTTGDEVDTVDDKKLMRKVDWMMMPLMFGCYYLQYTDKTLRKAFHRRLTRVC